MLPPPTPNWTPPTTLPRGPAYDPWAHADALGIRVIERPLEGVNELWFPDLRLIVLKASMRPAHLRNALAHGVAHAALGHRDDRPKHELQADRYAAFHLIDPVQLESAAAWSRDLGQLVSELGITRRLLLAHLAPGLPAAATR